MRKRVHKLELCLSRVMYCCHKIYDFYVVAQHLGIMLSVL